ncbi:MAG TPA: hypothetical protein DEH25_08075 [Chloroflexi bacterium]|nr:hypothetical protein [Chloroflexota bacterium]
MSSLKNPPMDDPKDLPYLPKSEGDSEQPATEAFITAVVSQEKAVLHEIKKNNKSGRPLMKIHEPRIRYNNGDTLNLYPEELLTDGGVLYYRSFEQPNLYVRKKDVTPTNLADTQNQQPGSESEPEQPVAETFITVVVTDKKALLHEINSLNKAGRPLMRIHEPRIRYNTGDKIKILPDELSTDGNVIYYRCFDQPDLYVQKADVTSV